MRKFNVAFLNSLPIETLEAELEIQDKATCALIEDELSKRAVVAATQKQVAAKNTVSRMREQQNENLRIINDPENIRAMHELRALLKMLKRLR